MKTTPLITDEQTLKSAAGRFGHAIPVYDDGFGPLFIHRDSMGISGIVRAQTWEDAYSICEDEFFPSADETEEEFIAEYGGDFTEDACWNEAYGFRPNGAREVGESGIYCKDLNGDSLDILTPDLLEALEITLEIESPEDVEPETRYFAWHESRRKNPAGRSVFSMAGKWGADYARISPSYVSRRKGVIRHSHYSPA